MSYWVKFFTLVAAVCSWSSCSGCPQGGAAEFSCDAWTHRGVFPQLAQRWERLLVSLADLVDQLLQFPTQLVVLGHHHLFLHLFLLLVPVVTHSCTQTPAAKLLWQFFLSFLWIARALVYLSDLLWTCQPQSTSAGGSTGSGCVSLYWSDSSCLGGRCTPCFSECCAGRSPGGDKYFGKCFFHSLESLGFSIKRFIFPAVHLAAVFPPLGLLYPSFAITSAY